MILNNDKILFTVLTGSRLYGTDTELSDYDYKAVIIPPLDDLLLNIKLVNNVKKPNASNDKMIPKASETEYIPIQVFFNDFILGQTYALEIAFAVSNGLFEVPNNNPIMKIYFQGMIYTLLDDFLTKDVRKMAGYAVSQSKLYGLKTERYTSINTALALIKSEYKISNIDRLKDYPVLLENLCKIPHIKITKVMNAKGGYEELDALEICGKKHSITTSWSTVIASLEKTILSYGERVKAFEGTGADFKALSHSIRITEQILELCNEGILTFPRPNANFLRDVKLGRIPLETASCYLENAFLKIDDAITNSILQEITPELESRFRDWKLKVLRRLYYIEENNNG